MNDANKVDLGSLKKDLLALRDELRLKIHLAGMDAKTEWEKLEPEAERVWNKTAEEAVLAANDLKKRFLELRAAITKH